MKRLLLVFFLFSLIYQSHAQVSAGLLEKIAYKISLDNFHNYFEGFAIVCKSKEVVRCVNVKNFGDSINFKLNSKGLMHIIEFKSKGKDFINDFKTSMNDDYAIYDEETMRLYFNKKRNISFNFYSLGDYKIVELFLNDRLTLEE